MRIDGCDISTGDDCIAIKSGRGAEAYALLQTTEDVPITNCTLADSIFACIGIGSETSGRHSQRAHRAVQVYSRADVRDLHQDSRGARRVHRRHFAASDLDVARNDAGVSAHQCAEQRDSG